MFYLLIFNLYVCLPELWNDGLQSRKNKKKDPLSPIKKKKPVVVSDILCNVVDMNFLMRFF